MVAEEDGEKSMKVTKYDVYAKNTALVLGSLRSTGVPYEDSRESFKALISQIARGVTDEDGITIVKRVMQKNEFGNQTGFQDSHGKHRTTLAELMGYEIKGTPTQIAEKTRIVKGLFEKRGWSFQKIENETKLTKPQIRHILGFDWSETY